MLTTREQRLHGWKLLLENVRRTQADSPYHLQLRARIQEIHRDPWGWPEAALSPHLQAVLRAHTKNAPIQPLSVGDTLLVGVNTEDQSTLMHLRMTRHTLAESLKGTVLESTKAAWRQSKKSAERVAPFVLNAHLDEIALQVVSLNVHDAISLDGKSYGLAFCLSHVSLLLHTPIPRDIVALAATDEHGNTLPVDGLDAKISKILHDALSIQRLLVHPTQVTYAQECIARHALSAQNIVAYGISKLADAVDIAWPDAPVFSAQRLDEPTLRAELIEELYVKLLNSKSYFQSWQGVIRTLQYLRQNAELSDELQLKCDFALSIAMRHEGEGDTQHHVRPRLNDLLQVERRADYRPAIVRQSVQSIFDGGKSATDDIKNNIAQCTKTLIQDQVIHTEDLKTLGAWARILVRDGQLEACAHLMNAVTDGWWEYRRDHKHEATHSLSVLLHAAGLAQTQSLLDQALRQMRRFEELRIDHWHWVQFSYARTLAIVGRTRESLIIFHELANNVHLRPFVRVSSTRWLARAYTVESGTCSSVDEVRESMQALDDSGDLVLTFLSLFELDCALFNQDTDAAQRVLRTLTTQTTKNELFKKLKETAPEGYPMHQWIADAYPY